MKRYSKLVSKAIVNLVVFLALVGTLSIRVLAADSPTSLDTGKSIVKQYYIGDIKDSIVDAATDMPSLVKSLNDPYSAYFTPQQYTDFTGSINNTFSGIGISIEASPDGIKIVSVFDSTPSKEVGLLTGDIITAAQGHELAGLSTEVATAYVRGATGTTVHLQVKRGATILFFDVIRKAIALPTVVGTLMDKHIGYIAISSFGETTATEFKSVYEGLKNNSADSYIIDLRNNGGGYMNTAFDIAGFFIGNNVALKVQPKTGVVTNYNATDEKELIDKPVIFLTNQYSASASEILSAAVKDYKKAIFIGEKTYGKGVAQTIFKLPDDSYLKLTVMRFVSPLGKEINKVGITPDLEIKDDVKLGIDSLSAARILFSNLSSKVDKSGLTKINVAGQDYQVDLNIAQSKDNINTFKYMEPNLFNTTQTLKVVASSSLTISGKSLPETGTLYDFSFYLGLGFTLMVAGVFITLKGSKK